MPRRSVTWRTVDWFFQWLWLLGLYLLFVGKVSVPELLVGAVVALLGVIAWTVTWEEGLGTVIADVRLLALVRYVFVQVVADTFRAMKVLALQLFARRPAPSLFRLVPFDPGGDDPRSVTRRALAVAYPSVSPNTVVLDIDLAERCLLLHQIVPAPTSELLKRLGAKE
jgi:multisubunit Na+/H+ antiporter MnhE subunit